MLKKKIFKKIFKYSLKDVKKFSELSQDINKIHTSEKYSEKTIFKKPIVQGMLISSTFGGLITQKISNPIYLSQNLNFKKPIFIDENFLTKIEIFGEEKKNGKNILKLKTEIFKIDQNDFENIGDLAVSGEAVILVFNKD